VIIALVIGTLLAVGALAFVLQPVFFGAAPDRARVAPRKSGPDGEREAAVVALREIEFDRETGKLSDVDYAELKARYTQQAIRAMRATQGPVAGTAVGAGTSMDDEIEATVRAFRQSHASCSTCGPRPEPDAVYCSTCGRYLRDRCAGCGAPVVAHDARYCENCGNRFAA
jgi:hypothetical protein